MPKSIEEHVEWFGNYARHKIEKCQGDRGPMELKLEHTMHVMEIAGKIARGERMPGLLERACLLAGLYHDLARFDQYLQFNTFRDSISFNHGLQAVRIIRKKRLLDDELPESRHLVLAAIACHNKRLLPGLLHGACAAIANVLRNADKLDIIRIMAKELEKKPYNPVVVLNLPDEERLCGKKVIADAFAGRTSSYDDLRSVNDFRVLLGSWCNDMRFESSRRFFADEGYGRQIVAALPDNELYGPVRRMMLETFESGQS